MRNMEFFFGLKELSCLLEFDRLARDGELKLCRELHSFQEPGILFSIIGQLVELSREKSGNHKFQKIFIHGLLEIIYI
jgi:hypothetical protein